MTCMSRGPRASGALIAREGRAHEARPDGSYGTCGARLDRLVDRSREIKKLEACDTIHVRRNATYRVVLSRFPISSLRACMRARARCHVQARWPGRSPLGTVPVRSGPEKRNDDAQNDRRDTAGWINARTTAGCKLTWHQ